MPQQYLRPRVMKKRAKLSKMAVIMVVMLMTLSIYTVCVYGVAGTVGIGLFCCTSMYILTYEWLHVCLYTHVRITICRCCCFRWLLWHWHNYDATAIIATSTILMYVCKYITSLMHNTWAYTYVVLAYTFWMDECMCWSQVRMLSLSMRQHAPMDMQRVVVNALHFITLLPLNLMGRRMHACMNAQRTFINANELNLIFIIILLFMHLNRFYSLFLLYSYAFFSTFCNNNV